jgi:Lipocalin-like domain
MNRRNILSLSATAALGLALLPVSAIAQQKSLKEQLVGTWTLVSWEQVHKDGTKGQDFGPNPKGITSFDTSGHFFVMFAKPELPKIASDRTKVTPQEAQAINVGSIAYFGTYTVDEPNKTVMLTIESSTFPNQLGISSKRIVTSLTADELKLTNATVVGGDGQINTAYRRAK